MQSVALKETDSLELSGSLLDYDMVRELTDFHSESEAELGLGKGSLRVCVVHQQLRPRGKCESVKVWDFGTVFLERAEGCAEIKKTGTRTRQTVWFISTR